MQLILRTLYLTNTVYTGKSKGFNAKTIDLEEFDENSLTTSPAMSIFLMATYGEGEPTDNAGKFYRWITNGEGKFRYYSLV